jgi:glycosyltransferase involved in cell wall biosynthesis
MSRVGARLATHAEPRLARVRIGVLSGSPAKGGVYQYGLAMIAALEPAAAAAQGDELVLLTGPSSTLDLDALARAGWQVRPPVPPTVPAESRLRRAARRLRPSAVRQRPELRAWHAELGIELMVYPAPGTYSFEAGTPYVIAVHDLQHRLQPEFPEVSADGQAEGREHLFRNAIAKATLVLADSDVGKEDVLELYGDVGITAERVKVLPFVPPPYILELAGEPDGDSPAAVRRRYGLPERYFYYPAQFWPHKNHERLVRAAALLRDRGTDVSLVFSGGRGSEIRERTHEELLGLVAELGLADRVHDLGFVSEQDVGPLYRGAVALAMPTFFGPTNIPVLEAWALGCPVLTSDLRGIREQVGGAGLLVDPRSVEQLADGMERLWTDEALRRELAANGRVRLAEYTADDFRARLAEILTEAKERVRQAAV